MTHLYIKLCDLCGRPCEIDSGMHGGHISTDIMVKKKKVSIAVFREEFDVALADNNMTIYSFKFYEDGTNLGLSFDDDTITTTAGATIQVQTRLENHLNESISVDLRGVLYDISGADIDRTKTITIPASDTSSAVVFEYFVPTDAKTGVYDYYFKYTYSYNGTTYKTEKTFSFEIEKEVVDINDILKNLTENILNEREEKNNILEAIQNSSDTTTTLTNLIVGQFISINQSYEQCKINLAYSDANYSDYFTRYTQCTTEKQQMLSNSQCENDKTNAINKALSDQTGRNNGTYMWIAIIIGVVWWFKRKKAMPGGQGEGTSLNATFPNSWGF